MELIFLFDPWVYAYPLDLAVSLFDIPLPKTISGTKAPAIKAILHDNVKEIINPTVNAKIDSKRIETVSVERPFNNDISSDKILLNTPGALAFESNHPISL